MPLNPQKTWLITGVSSGLGRALAQAALQSGDRVVGTVRREADRRAFVESAPGAAHAVLLDVTERDAVFAAVARIEAEIGAVDVLVNNAGQGFIGAVEEAGPEEIRRQFEVNVFGAVSVMQAVLPYLRARRAGHIVNITSVSGLVGWPSLGIYSGTKFALEGITETLAQEVAHLGIRVTLIEPGGFRTDFAGRSMSRAQRCIAGDYDASAGACKRILAEHAGHERGDPARAAQAILAAVAAEQPPLRLLLGADAVGYVTEKWGAMQAEMGRWMEYTMATDLA